LLHDLNLAKLRQQDDELSTNIKVVDSPYYPLRPLASKTLFLVILAGIIGFFLIVAILIALEYFDTTIKTPERAEKYIGLKVAGIYPRITKHFYSADLDFILPRLIEIMAQNVKLALCQTPEMALKRPQTVLFFSMLDAEGKTTIGRELTKKLKSFGDNVLYLNFYKSSTPALGNNGYTPDLLMNTPADEEIQYEVNDRFIDLRTLENLIPGFDLPKQEQYDYILVELPSLINHPYPLDIIRQFDLSLLVIRANRSWKEADLIQLDAFKTICKRDPLALLNGVELDFLDSVFGDVPKPRSEFRRRLKRILLFQFREKSRV
jgi:hypothetical protein